MSKVKMDDKASLKAGNYSFSKMNKMPALSNDRQLTSKTVYKYVEMPKLSYANNYEKETLMEYKTIN